MLYLNIGSGNLQTWTTEQLVNFSKDLGNAYCPGLNQAESSNENETWTTDKLVSLSESLAHAYSTGL